MLALPELLKRKDTLKHLNKSKMENDSFFNCKQMFQIGKFVKAPKYNCLYWISKKADDSIIDKHVLRQELFALNDQLALWNLVLLILTI